MLRTESLDRRSERAQIEREAAEDSLIAAISVAGFLAARIDWDDVADDLFRAKVSAQRRRLATGQDAPR